MRAFTRFSSLGALLVFASACVAGGPRTAPRPSSLVVPVAGVSARQLNDSYGAARDGGRRSHAGIDILARRGTPVVSADHGRVVRMSRNPTGGITLYAVDRSGRWVYYYAHLHRYQRGLKVGQRLRKGQRIGYVGTTGNAPRNLPHLHFEIMRMPRNGRYWEGQSINPYRALAGARAVGRSGGGEEEE